MMKKTTYIIKRDGSTERFNKKKLSNAMYKAHKSVGVKITKQETDRHTDEIINLHGYYNMDDLTIERIQDDVEMFLMDKKYFETAKGYITYRREQEIIRENPWADNDERQDLILQKYLINGETKKDFINRISYGNPKLNKIFRKKEAIFGGRILYAIGREGNITGSNCFIKDTKVITNQGKKNIQEIQTGDEVLTRDGSYQIVNKTMTNKHIGDMIRFKSSFLNDDIVTTPNHEFLTQKGWVKADEIIVNKKKKKEVYHFIKFRDLNLEEPEDIEINTTDVLKNIIGDKFVLEDINEYQLQPKVLQNYNGQEILTKGIINPINKKFIIDKDLSYVFGRFLGDGSITRRKDTKHNLYSVWQIVGNIKEKKELDRCADIMEEKFGIKVNRGETKSGQQTYVIRADSIAVSEIFNHFVGSGFNKKFVHDIFKTRPSFLYGVFDSDGSIDKRKAGSITLNNPEVIKNLKEMLDHFGVPSYISTKINAVKKYGNYPMLIIPRNSLSLIINNINKKYNDDRTNVVAHNYGRVKIFNNKAYIRMDEKIIEKREEYVYNISVENNHDYVVDNLHVHNCYVATAPKDSLRDIYRADYEIARTYSYGGGQGMNLSNLRPKGAKVNNTSNTTPGIMVFAEKYSHTTLNTQQENRRGALMLMLNIDHPDVIDFITAKLDLNKINGANISLAISDDFMKAYEADEYWIMRFESPYEIIEKTVKAKDLMALISYSAHSVGDPGVVFIDTVNNYHLLSEYPDVYFNATNPCGEQPLMENGNILNT